MQKTNTPQKLFNLPLLLFIITVLLLLLLLLFPWTTAKYMEQQTPDLLREQFSSRLKTQYYQILKNSDKNKKNILQIAYSLGGKGYLQASIHLLTDIIIFPDLNQRQQSQYHLILLANYIDLYHKSSGLIRDKRQLVFKIRTQLQQLEQQYKYLSNKELKMVAKASTDFGLFPLAVNFYYQLAEKNSINKAKWLAEAGRWANQTQDYKTAAEAFKLASEALEQSKIFDQYTEKWLVALVKGNQQKEIKQYYGVIEKNMPQSLLVVEKLANISIQAGLYQTASMLFNHLALYDQIEQKQRWYEKASYWAYKAENYNEATKYLIKAKEITNNNNERWVIQQRLIDIYTKNNKPEQALSIILSMLKEVPESHNLLDNAIQIALRNKRISTARELNKDYLQRNPNSFIALNNQIDIEIYDKKYATAILYVKKIIRLAPRAIKPRQQWAQLEEYKGNHKLALELWQWIYKASNDPKHLQKIIQLAQENLKQGGLNILRHISLQHPLPKQAVYDVFYYLSNTNNKNSAEQFLKNYLNTNGVNKDLLETLAKWYAGEKRYKESLQQWQLIEKSFSSNKITRLNIFELYWLLQQRKKAYQLWLKDKKQWAKLANSKQLAIMADIAWRYRHRKIALSYYKKLLKKRYKYSAKKQAFYYMRVAILYKKLGKPRTALSTYRKGFINTHKTNLLINGLQLSFDRGDRYNFKRFITLAKKHQRQFRSKARYWLLRAADAQRNKNYKTALHYYRKVLLLKPKSSEAKNAIRSINQYLSKA